MSRGFGITRSLANGADILKVKEMAGHASLATTQRCLHDLEALADNAVDYNPLIRIAAITCRSGGKISETADPARFLKQLNLVPRALVRTPDLSIGQHFLRFISHTSVVAT